MNKGIIKSIVVPMAFLLLTAAFSMAYSSDVPPKHDWTIGGMEGGFGFYTWDENFTNIIFGPIKFSVSLSIFKTAILFAVILLSGLSLLIWRVKKWWSKDIGQL